MGAVEKGLPAVSTAGELRSGMEGRYGLDSLQVGFSGRYLSCKFGSQQVGDGKYT